jgi:YVTN family beta-propeller protein
MLSFLQRTLALVAVTLVAIGCASSNAPSTTSSAPTAAAATPTPTPAPTPCTTQSVLTGPAQASLPAPAGTAPVRTVLPVVATNMLAIAVSRIPIPPIAGKTASIDIIEIDQASHLMYVTDRGDNGIDVFDVANACAKFIKTIDVGSGPNGVVVAKNVNKVFAGLNDSTIAVIDITPGVDKVIAKLTTGGKGRADEMDYDPKDKKVYVANSDDGIVTVVDAMTNAIIKKFEGMGDALEQPRYDPADGMMYMTSSGQNAIFQFDPTKDVLVKKFDVGQKCDPNGLAINPTTQQAFLGCSSRSSNAALLWDLKTGKVVDSFDQAGAGDAVFYSAKADRFFFAASNFNRGAVMAIFSANPVKFIGNVATATGSHAVAYDEANGIVYMQDQNPNEGALFSFPAPK